MPLRDALFRLRARMNFQVLKHTWLDIKRDKAKMMFGISGIAISLFILTAISILNSTQSYNYIKTVTITTGAADIVISRTIQSDLTYDPFFEQTVVTEDLQNIEGIEDFFSRIMMYVKISSNKTTASGTLPLYGIDFKNEAENGRMGDLVIVDENGQISNEIYVGKPNNGECVILEKAAELLNVSRGDFVHLIYQNYELDVKVIEICVQDQKFLEFETALIIVNMNEAQSFLNRENQINYVYGTIQNPELVYDASDISLTTRKLREIGTRVQERLDINEFTVSMPKLEELEAGEFQVMGTTIVFWFITVLSMLITGILINSILSTSTEERVREFGILRVVGGKKPFPLKIVFLEGIFLGIVGSIIGIILGLIFTEPISRLVIGGQEFDFFKGAEIEFVVQMQSVITTFVIGVFVSLGVSLIPAIRTARINLIKSITPFQTKEEGWEIKKEGSMNVRSFLIGISISSIGMVMFVVLPRIMVTADFMLVASLFIGLLAAILLGLVFASIGIIPLIQKLFIGIISPTLKKYGNIIKISLKRYRRRNTSTVVMFAISFSFIFFITTYMEMSTANYSLNFRFQYGTDLVIINQGTNIDNSLTLSTLDEIREIPGIEKVAISFSNTVDITAALSLIFDFGEGGIGFEEESTEQTFANLFQFYASEEQEKIQVRVGDILNHHNLQAGFIGIDEDFIDIVDEDLLIWSSPNSGFNYSFTEMLEHNNTCIIAKSIATVLGIEDVGATIRLTFFNPKIENDPGNITLFRVVGITGGIPGFYNFRSSEASANGGGVMVSTENYMRLMNLENYGEPNMIVDKIYITLTVGSEENIKDTKGDIQIRFRELDFIIDDAISKINYIEEMNDMQSTIMEIILTFTVLICIFGLISSMYAVFMERKLEIGILRSMGMRTSNVRNMFLLESMIIMLSAGILGTIIGTYSAYLLQTNMSLMTELPVVFSIPIDTLVRVFVLSISIGIVGMYTILIVYLYRKSIVDIFRQTF